jgi:nucleoside-diphosphate-sugar epimerase/sugar phosphate isomerase/epimerase
MSTGSAAIPQLKAAPEAEQLAERLRDGTWRGLELCLMPRHVADDAATAQAVRTVLEAAEGRDLALTAEAPVAWPSGAFVRVDRLDDEARAGIERSADFAAGIGSPVLTIHLYVPLTPAEFRARGPLDEEAVTAFLTCFAEACRARGVAPLIENVPPVLRMRTGGVYLSTIGGHWRDLVEWTARIPGLGVTLDTSHAALFEHFAAAYPSLFGLGSAEELSLERYVAELAPLTRVAHVSGAHGLLGEGLPFGVGEVDLAPAVAALGAAADFLVAEVNEPDPAVSPDMKAGYREVERLLAAPPAPWPRAPRRIPREHVDWQAVVGRRDPVPSVLELQERFGGRRVLVTGGGGLIGRTLATLLHGFRHEHLTVLDSHEGSLTADRRARTPAERARIDHVLCDVRDRGRIQAEIARARPDVVFHLAAYKHVDWAETYPEEFVDTNLHGSWNVLRAAEGAGVETVVVASTDKAAMAASFYGRTKRLMEQLTAYAARDGGGDRIAVRLVNVLDSAGSASELFVRQARAGLPLTITDPSMLRYWITLPHAAALVAHAALLAGEREVLATAADPAQLSVGELGTRIWSQVGPPGPARSDLLGIRRGETLTEVLVGEGESLAPEGRQGIAAITGDVPTAGAAWISEHLPDRASREDARAVWLEAMRRPGLVAARAGS